MRAMNGINMENLSIDSNVPTEYMGLIVRTISIGYGGYIIGKKGSFKKQLLDEYGATLTLTNNPEDLKQQIIVLECPEDQRKDVEHFIDSKIASLKKITLKTPTSNPGQLKLNVPHGKLLPAYIMNFGPYGDDLMLMIDDAEWREAFNRMDETIQLEYNSDENKPQTLPTPFGNGCMCIARATSNRYYRAYVVETICIETQWFVIAYFLDVGRFEQLPLHRLYKLKEKFMKVPYRVLIAKWNNLMLDDWTSSPYVRATQQVQENKFGNLTFPQRLPTTAELIFAKFMCRTNSGNKSPIQRVPVKLYVFCTHYEGCMPYVNVYVPRQIAEEVKLTPNVVSESKNEFIDMLDFLCRIGLASMKNQTVNVADYHRPPNFDTLYQPYITFRDSAAGGNDVDDVVTDKN